MKKILRITAIVLLAALIIAVGAFLIWGLNPLGPTDRAMAALESDPDITVTQDGWISFQPTAAQPISGFIFYPGGHVDYRSYAPLARQLAARGYYVAIVRMPLSLAVFGINKAGPVVAAHPEIRYWSIGGHSLGGVMAARYAFQHPDEIQGVAFLASYPADDLSTSQLKGLQTYGSNDTVLNMDALAGAMPLLPPGTIKQIIEGGNHAQFGDYGPQPGDSPASISAEQQQSQTVDLLARLLRAVEGE